MEQHYCPGAKMLRQPSPELFSCPRCGEEVEIWTDELKANCPKCGKTVVREDEGSCLDWCKFGKDCVGEETYSRYITRKTSRLKERLISEVGFEGDDGAEAIRIATDAEELAKREGAELHIVVPAAILLSSQFGETSWVAVENVSHDGKQKNLPRSIRRQESQAHNTVPLDHPRMSSLLQVDRSIDTLLLKQGLQLETIREIETVLRNGLDAQEQSPVNCRVVHDAFLLERLRKKGEKGSDKEIESVSKRTAVSAYFLTETGKERAKERGYF